MTTPVVNYRDVKCCDGTRNTDAMLQRFRKEKSSVLQDLTKEPEKLSALLWQPGGPLMVDDECMCAMGKYRGPSGSLNASGSSGFVCPQCRNMGRLIDFKNTPQVVGTPFLIECGAEAGQYFQVQEYPIVGSEGLFLRSNPRALERAQLILKRHQELQECGTPGTLPNFFQGDRFTNEILVGWAVEEVLQRQFIPQILKYYTAFVCRGRGYILQESVAFGTLKNLARREELLYRPSAEETPRFHPVVARSIMVQLLSILKALSASQFTHGSPSIQALLFDTPACSYFHEGVRVSGPFTLKIGHLGMGSITLGESPGVRIFSASKVLDQYLDRSTFAPQINVIRTKMAGCGAEYPSMKGSEGANVCSQSSTSTVYRLNNDTATLFHTIRHVGIPLFPGSFDCYCFMTGLMADKFFFEGLASDPGIYRLWAMMWTPGDLRVVEERLREVHRDPKEEPLSTKALVDLLKGLSLRCDVVEFLWDLLKKGW